MKAPRGLLDYSLSGYQSKSAVTWKITGNFNGEKTVELSRGPLNEGSTFAERQGFHLPGASFEIWQRRAPRDGLSQPGVGLFATTFNLDYPYGYDIPTSIVFTNTSAVDDPRARGLFPIQLFVNGWQFGKYIVEGVNQFIIHGQPYSGKYWSTTWPGYTAFSYFYSEMWSDKQPAWNHGFSNALGYIGRLQYSQQTGKLRTDVAVYNKSATDFAFASSLTNSTDIIHNESGFPVILSGGDPSYYMTGAASEKENFTRAIALLKETDNIYSVVNGEIADQLSSLSLDPQIRVQSDGDIIPVINYHNADDKIVIPLRLESNQTALIGFNGEIRDRSNSILQGVQVPSTVLGHKYSATSSQLVDLHVAAGGPGIPGSKNHSAF
ncbi:hypothetical protein N7447_002548 [Penicillium robsamsonii]|uniref:uncharacterized protein n=1 Tax=Penicillium robsamsonii TaxID=1792511 RepID=UPI002546F8A4|nr:uncharacterized protein N7447_002548 [Penicillium robsamsonii]KAJ5836522.1 hypothetical protein N7447_002548 [Penicillium robsamsonii]